MPDLNVDGWKTIQGAQLARERHPGNLVNSEQKGFVGSKLGG